MVVHTESSPAAQPWCHGAGTEAWFVTEPSAGTSPSGVSVAQLCSAWGLGYDPGREAYEVGELTSITMVMMVKLWLF